MASTSGPAYCQHCGARLSAEAEFCPSCGRPVTVASGPQTGQLPSPPPIQPQTPVATLELPNLISTPRIVWFGIFSFGLYIFYWFYLTWKHYRDHAGRDAYPVWHALTLAVPIYNFFRLHAHMRVYKDLMSDSRVPSTLKPGTFVIVFAISWLLTLLNNAVESIEGAAESLEFLVVSMLLLATSLALNIWVMAQVQGNLNRYWNSLPNVKAVNAPIGVGEVILVIVGVAIFLLSFLIGFVEGVSEL